MHHQGVFRVSGSQHEINEFRNQFEQGTSLRYYCKLLELYSAFCLLIPCYSKTVSRIKSVDSRHCSRLILFPVDCAHLTLEHFA